MRGRRGSVAESNPSRAEAIREQLSEILFGDEEHSTAQCLSELRRRKEIEERRTEWLKHDGFMVVQRDAAGVSVALFDTARDIEDWTPARQAEGADLDAATDLALSKVGAA
jgi:hypothetical protein